MVIDKQKENMTERECDKYGSGLPRYYKII